MKKKENHSWMIYLEKKKHEVLVNVLRQFYMEVIRKFNKTASHNDFKLGGHKH